MKRTLLPALFVLILLSACNKHFYAPALFNNDISYQPRPGSFDSAKHSGYISAGMGVHQGVSSTNTLTFGELNIGQGHDLGGVNVAYGAYGYAGAIANSNYDNDKSDPYSFSSIGFGGVGGRFAINGYTKLGNADFRFLGFEGSYNKEFGDYARFRRTVEHVGDFSTITRTELVTIGGSSEVLWHDRLEIDRQYAIRLFIGKTLGNFNQITSSDYYEATQGNSVYVTASYFMQISKFYGVAELNRGITPVTGFRIKFGYRF